MSYSTFNRFAVSELSIFGGKQVQCRTSKQPTNMKLSVKSFDVNWLREHYDAQSLPMPLWIDARIDDKPIIDAVYYTLINRTTQQVNEIRFVFYTRNE